MFGSDSLNPLAVDSVAHVIQIALTPVFLLSGIAALLGVFSTRLARVSDRFETVSQKLEGASPELKARLLMQLAYLHRRSLALDAAVILGTIGGGATCGAALALFVGALRNAAVESLLFLCFGLGLFCTIGALIAFLTEMLIASRGLRQKVEARRSKIQEEAVDADSEPDEAHADETHAAASDSTPSAAG